MNTRNTLLQTMKRQAYGFLWQLQEQTALKISAQRPIDVVLKYKELLEKHIEIQLLKFNGTK